MNEVCAEDGKYWLIYHRADSTGWHYMKTEILGFVDGRPLVRSELPCPAVTSWEFLFRTEQDARQAADKKPKM